MNTLCQAHDQRHVHAALKLAGCTARLTWLPDSPGLEAATDAALLPRLGS